MLPSHQVMVATKEYVEMIEEANSLLKDWSLIILFLVSLICHDVMLLLLMLLPSFLCASSGSKAALCVRAVRGLTVGYDHDA